MVSFKIIFHIFRLQAFDFKDLKDALSCPITVSKNVIFYQTKVDEFLEIFKKFVESNPPYNFQNEVNNLFNIKE